MARPDPQPGAQHGQDKNAPKKEPMVLVDWWMIAHFLIGLLSF
jgi:hypothetical protein